MEEEHSVVDTEEEHIVVVKLEWIDSWILGFDV